LLFKAQHSDDLEGSILKIERSLDDIIESKRKGLSDCA
jgi:hypothetical protein